MEFFADNLQASEKQSTFKSKSGSYWGGFITGAAIGTGVAAASLYFANSLGNRSGRILRLEDSVQIGQPVERVFRAWTNLEALAECLEFVNAVRIEGNTSYWEVVVDGKTFKWQAQTVQFLPNEAIGWKSISGPKHSGRINFSKIGDDTLVHVTMNYAPPLGRFGRMLSPITDHLEGYITKSLRDFKAAMEDGSPSGVGSSTPALESDFGGKKSAVAEHHRKEPVYRYPSR